MKQNDLFPETAHSVLKLLWRGIPPSFKNAKMMVTKTPKGERLDPPILITRPDVQRRKAAITASFESQLRFDYLTNCGATSMGCSLQSWIASSMPEDDCWTRVPVIQARAVLCAPGEESVEVVIERL